MHVIAIIFGLLLLVFGGGCTLFIVGGGLLSDGAALVADLPLLATILVPFGIVPAIGGWFLFRWGLKVDRAKRRAQADGGQN
jgi:hypothetical protein